MLAYLWTLLMLVCLGPRRAPPWPHSGRFRAEEEEDRPVGVDRAAAARFAHATAGRGVRASRGVDGTAGRQGQSSAE